MRKRTSFTYTLTDFHRFHLRRQKKEKGILMKENIDLKSYKAFMEDILVMILKAIIYEKYTFIMPYSLGALSVFSKKQSVYETRIDYRTSKLYKKKVRFLNLATGGRVYGLKWHKKRISLKNKSVYKFNHIDTEKAYKRGVGKKRLSEHILELANDPNRKSYFKM